MPRERPDSRSQDISGKVLLLLLILTIAVALIALGVSG
jgi:hypothetical protein